MGPYVELGVLIVAAIAGGAWLVYALIPRLRGREVDVRLACPRTGADVDCTMVHDESQDRFVGVRACSAHPMGAPPPCDQNCAKLLNIGIPLRPSRPAPPREGT